MDEQPSLGEECEFDFSEMLAWLKGLALDPCNLTGTELQPRELWHRTLTLRKILNLDSAERPRRKRVLQQLYSKSSPPFGLSPERPSHHKQNTKRLRTGFSSYVRSSVDTTECSNVETVSCSSVDTTESSNVETVSCSSDGMLTSQDSAKQLDDSQKKHRKSVKFLKVETKTRPVIPLGPLFQAEVPVWTGSHNPGSGNNDGDSETLKWLGTRVWPLEGENEGEGDESIGKGRSVSCSCRSPGSATCIKRHILKVHLRLRSSLGPAFLSWKFDEMGEFVSRSWTMKDKKKFDSLLKSNPITKKGGFWEVALKQFPSKCQKDLVSYYYNVIIPGRLSELTKASLGGVLSDEDQANDEDEVKIVVP